MKKLVIVTVIVVITNILLTGCAVKTGNEKLQDVTQSSVTEIIKNGTTTKAEVKKVLGEPNDVVFTDSGLEKNEQIILEKLVLFFDEGVVKNHSFSFSDCEAMGGLVR